MTNNEEIGVIRTTLNKHFGNSEKCRKFFSSSPDTECRNARDLNLNHEDNACNGYLTIRQRNDYNQYFNANNFDIRQERDIGIIVNDQQLRSNKNKNEVGIWGSWYNEKKKEEEEGYKIGWVEIGKCWLCGNDVIFYCDGTNQTQGGQCEHIGAITASLLAGMLYKQNFKWLVYNYGNSHTHCNQQKSDNISMDYNYNEGTGEVTWNYDNNKTERICKDILNGNPHATEYDPYQEDWIKTIKGKGKRPEINAMKERIKAKTEAWCTKANEITNSDNIKKVITDYNNWYEHNRDKLQELGLANKNDLSMDDENINNVRKKAKIFVKDNIELLINEAFKNKKKTRGGSIRLSRRINPEQCIVLNAKLKDFGELLIILTAPM